MKKQNRWSEEEIKLLIDNLDKTYEELEKIIINKNKKEIKSKCQKEKYKTASYQQKWTKEEEEKLVAMEYSKTLEDVYEIFNNRSKDSIRGKIQCLGLSIKTKKYWTQEEEHILINNSKKHDVKELEKLLPRRNKVGIYKKIKKMNLEIKYVEKPKKEKPKKIKNKKVKEKKKYIPKPKYYTMNQAFKQYKRKLNKEVEQFGKPLLKNQIILLFKYYLRKNEINYTKEWIYNTSWYKELDKAMLKTYVKKRWNSTYEFLCECFPTYGLKEYNFKSLQVREGFWNNDYNCYDNIQNGIIRAKKDGIINEEYEILCLDINTLYQYFHKSMLYFRHMDILYKYLDYHNINYSRKLYYDNTRFDSIEEKRLYIYIKNTYNLDIKKCDKKFKFYNEKYNEHYIPDFEITKYNNMKLDKPVIIEYYGLYSTNRENETIIKYVAKTHRKNEYYKSNKEMYFIDIYPYDFKNNFEGIQQKLGSFLLFNNMTFDL